MTESDGPNDGSMKVNLAGAPGKVDGSYRRMVVVGNTGGIASQCCVEENELSERIA